MSISRPLMSFPVRKKKQQSWHSLSKKKKRKNKQQSWHSLSKKKKRKNKQQPADVLSCPMSYISMKSQRSRRPNVYFSSSYVLSCPMSYINTKSQRSRPLMSFPLRKTKQQSWHSLSKKKREKTNNRAGTVSLRKKRKNKQPATSSITQTKAKRIPRA